MMETRNNVPSIEATEPVYPTAESEESVWVTCTLQWDGERFVNEEMNPEWVLDDHAFPDSTYVVEGRTFDDMEEAKMFALYGDEIYG